MVVLNPAADLHVCDGLSDYREARRLCLMAALIIFVCSGLLVYWSSRMLLLLNGAKGEIDETLESDLW